MPELLMNVSRLKSTMRLCSPLPMCSMTTCSNERAFALSSRPTGSSTSAFPSRSAATSMFINPLRRGLRQPAARSTRRRFRPLVQIMFQRQTVPAIQVPVVDPAGERLHQVQPQAADLPSLQR